MATRFFKNPDYSFYDLQVLPIRAVHAEIYFDTLDDIAAVPCSHTIIILDCPAQLPFPYAPSHFDVCQGVQAHVVVCRFFTIRAFGAEVHAHHHCILNIINIMKIAPHNAQRAILSPLVLLSLVNVDRSPVS